jgi:two-component system, NarL family, nitrate/nitrite sensor histidine kinase NarX
MQIDKWMKQATLNYWQILIFITSFTLIYLFWWLSVPTGTRVTPQFWLIIGLVSVFFSWLGRKSLSLIIKQHEIEEKNHQLESNLKIYERQLAALLKLNYSLSDIQDEKELMDTALRIIADIAGSKATSFVTLDEWGQTLPAYAQGVFPDNLLHGWAEHLISERTRQVCSVCQNLQAQPGNSCPLLKGPFLENYSVYCLPVQRGDKLVGLLNLYFPGSKSLTSQLREILNGVLNEIVIAIQGIRLRNQELNILRQMQLGRSVNMDFTTQIRAILSQLRTGMSAEFARIQIRPSDNWQSGLRVDDGLLDNISSNLLEMVVASVVESGLPHPQSVEEENKGQPSQVWAVPLVSLSGVVEGALLVGWKTAQNLDINQKRLLLVTVPEILKELETERYIISLGYKITLQERKRLAREIHDSLAQNLAFIKLQTAQMQIFLRQHDFSRLELALDQNYQALSEAYFQTREAIDNLRLKPEQELVNWLEQVASDFEESSGLKVLTTLQPPDHKLLPEVQAQLVRIVQEALSNIRKHAGASQVQIGLRIWEGEIILEICDDGKGFQPQDILTISQHGLRGMRERAELIGADFQIESQPQKGTKVRLRLLQLAESGL